MSTTTATNVDAFRAAWDAYACARTEALLACLDPEIEWRPTITAGPVRGHDEMRVWLATIQRSFKSLTLVLETVRDVADDCLVAFGRVTAFDHSGMLSHDLAIAWVAEFRDGRILRATSYADRDEALRFVAARRERFL